MYIHFLYIVYFVVSVQLLVSGCTVPYSTSMCNVESPFHKKTYCQIKIDTVLCCRQHMKNVEPPKFEPH